VSDLALCEAAVAFWVLGATWALHMYAYRVASALTLTGETLMWRAPRRTRCVDIADLVAIRPAYGGVGDGGIEALELADGTRLLLMVRKGLQDFAAELAARRPGITIEFGLYPRSCERLQFRTGFSRGTPP